MSKILGNVCVLATEHNVCRAYLGQLDDLGLVPEQILYFQRTKPDGVRIRAMDLRRRVQTRFAGPLRGVRRVGLKFALTLRMRNGYREKRGHHGSEAVMERGAAGGATGVTWA